MMTTIPERRAKRHGLLSAALLLPGLLIGLPRCSTGGDEECAACGGEGSEPESCANRCPAGQGGDDGTAEGGGRGGTGGTGDGGVAETGGASTGGTAPFDDVGTSLGVATSGRYFVRHDGKPLFWLCDTLYNLWGNSSREDVTWILDRRKKQGYTAIKFYADTRAPNAWGIEPYGAEGKAGAFNPSYFDHIDWIIEEARKRDMFVFFVERDTPRWTSAQAAWYGERYQRQPNIIWSSFNYGDNHESVTEALLLGITGREIDWKSDDPDVDRAIVGTYFGDTTPAGEGGGVVTIVGGVAGSKTYSSVPYDRTPALPILHADGFYTGAAAGDLDYRRAMYGIFFEGAFFTAGNNEWYGVAGEWKDHVDDPGPARTALFAHLFQDTEWWKLVPADDALSAAGKYTHALKSSEGDVLWVYFGDDKEIGVSLGAFSELKVHGTWINPASGEMRDAGQYDTNSDAKVRPPAGWVDALLAFRPGPAGPIAWLSSPQPGAKKVAPNSWVLAVEASGRGGASVTKVEFLVDGEVFHTDASAPFEATTVSLSADAYVLSARAYDSAGHDTSTAVVAVAVQPKQSPLVITTPAKLPDGRVGESYLDHYVSFESTSLRGEDWVVTGGELPPGMNLHHGQWGHSGGYSGTPEKAGTFQFKVGLEIDGKLAAEKSFTHVIVP